MFTSSQWQLAGWPSWVFTGWNCYSYVKTQDKGFRWYVLKILQFCSVCHWTGILYYVHMYMYIYLSNTCMHMHYRLVSIILFIYIWNCMLVVASSHNCVRLLPAPCTIHKPVTYSLPLCLLTNINNFLSCTDRVTRVPSLAKCTPVYCTLLYAVMWFQ